MPYGETLIRTLIKTLILTLMFFFLNTKSTKETKISFVLCIPCSNENAKTQRRKVNHEHR